jgi:hypothetical protein
MDTFASTTVLLVRREGKVCMASDGQVTMNNSTIVKSGARKVRRIAKGKVLVGFAGGGGDGLTLLTRLEEKLEEFGGSLERAVRGGRRPRRRLRLELRPRRGAGTDAQHLDVRRRDRAGIDEDRGRDLRLHQRPADP